jgi:GTP-binding protein
VAARLRKQDRPVILLANKMDQANLLAAELGELYALGFGEPLAISATHHQNIDQLHDRLEEAVGEAAVAAPPEEGLKLAIVGKRNAGKSTFINALAGETRVIASERPGTTRDSVDVTLRIDGRPITVIDTAGVKKKRKLADDVEFYSQHRAMRSVRRADVVAMLIDASLPVSQVDKDLAGVVAEHFKPVVIVVNKWDLAEDLTDPDDYAEYFAKTFPALGFAPITFTKATEGFNVRETLALAEQLYQQASCRVPTAQLNEALQAITAHRGPSHKSGTKRPKIYYASQVATNPPTIVCFVNDVRSFDETYIRFLANQFRDHLPFAEVPLRVFVRNRSRENR